MSMPFNDTTTRKGLVQFYERECGFNFGDVSGNAALLAEFTADVNVSIDDFMAIALPAGGTWQVDDTNQTDYPIIMINLVAGQRDYPFTVDGSGNLILEIFKVFVADSGGTYREIMPVDVETGAVMPNQGNASGQLYGAGLSSFTDGKNTQGTPSRYDKLANGIFLDPIPSYSYSQGLKVYVDREGSYFSVGDTTKKPGVPGLFHKYFYLKPAREYARRNSLDNFPVLDAEVTKLEGNPRLGIVGEIGTFFAMRTRDERKQLQVGMDSNE